MGFCCDGKLETTTKMTVLSNPVNYQIVMIFVNFILIKYELKLRFNQCLKMIDFATDKMFLELKFNIKSRKNRFCKFIKILLTGEGRMLQLLKNYIFIFVY